MLTHGPAVTTSGQNGNCPRPTVTAQQQNTQKIRKLKLKN